MQCRGINEKFKFQSAVFKYKISISKYILQSNGGLNNLFAFAVNKMT